MTWVRLDDRFAQHPKVVAAGPLAMAMQVAALGYCNRELTDGFVPRAIARTLLDFEIERDGKRYTVAVTCGMAGDDVSAAWVIAGLVQVGMWEEVPGGYHIHDYLDYQPTKEEVLELREKRAEAGRLGGLQRAANFQANEANAKQYAKQEVKQNPSKTEAKFNPTPIPVPTPVNPEPEPESFAPSREPYTAEFETFWKEYPRTNGTKLEAFRAWKFVAKGDRSLALAGLAKWKASDHWHEGKIVYAERYLKRRMWNDDPAPSMGVNGLVSDAELEEVKARARSLGYQGVVEEIPRP